MHSRSIWSVRWLGQSTLNNTFKTKIEQHLEIRLSRHHGWIGNVSCATEIVEVTSNGKTQKWIRNTSKLVNLVACRSPNLHTDDKPKVLPTKLSKKPSKMTLGRMFKNNSNRNKHPLQIAYKNQKQEITAISPLGDLSKLTFYHVGRTNTTPSRSMTNQV